MIALSKATLRGDFYGGVTAAIVALPLALAFGVAAYSALGPEYASRGALAGLLGAVCTGFFASAFGGTPSQVTGLTGPMTVVATAFIADLLAEHGMNVALITLFLGLAVCIGGALQVVFGLVGGGRLIKYMPYPVVAGFMNGIAIIIFISQIKPFLGVSGDWANFRWQHAAVTVTVGTVTIAVMMLCVHHFPKVPAALAALFAGAAVYLGAAWAGLAPLTLADNPLVIGIMPNPFADLEQMRVLMPMFHPRQFTQIEMFDLRMAVEGGVVLAILGSIDSLLTSLIADQLTHRRHDSNRELIGQGIGNLVSGLVGGLPGAGATVRTVVNIRAGGRTPWSGMLHAVIIAIVVVFLSNLAAWIPLAALAGILFITAVTMVDYYSVRLFKRKLARSEFFVMLLVTGVTVLVDLMIAVGIGVVVATGLFVVQQIKQPVIWRRMRGNEVFSRRRRTRREIDILQQEGKRTLLYELRGSLFFGTTDALISEVEGDLDSAQRFVFDFARVRDIDVSGVKILSLIIERLQDRGREVYFSGLLNNLGGELFVYRVLEDLGVIKLIGHRRIYPAFHWALEAIEDAILERLLPNYEGREYPFSLRDFDLFFELSDAEVAELESYLGECSFRYGEVLCSQGQPIDRLFFVRRGKLALWQEWNGTMICLTSAAAGSVVGWRALLDPEYQYLDVLVRAESDGLAYTISQAELQSLVRARPVVYIHLLQEVLRYIFDRIQILNTQLALLEEQATFNHE